MVMERGQAVQVDTPLALYEAPGNAFVSGFVGKTNLMAGKVVDAESLTVGEVALPADHGGLASGAAVRVSLRPEKITLGDPGQGLTATVGTAVFHGSHWLYTLESPLGDLIAVAPNTGAPPWASGAEVSLTWPRSALLVLPTEAGHG